MLQQREFVFDGEGAKCFPSGKKVGRPRKSTNLELLQKTEERPAEDSPYTEEQAVDNYFYKLRTVTYEAAKKEKGFTPSDIAEMYQIPKWTVRKAIHDGILSAIEFGGFGRGVRYVIPETELQKIEDHREEILGEFVFRSYMKKKAMIK